MPTLTEKTVLTPQLFWDTYQTWNDPLPTPGDKGAARFLFDGHPQAKRPPGAGVTNCRFWDGLRLPMIKEPYEVHQVGMQVRASSAHIADAIREQSSVGLHVQDRVLFKFPGRLAWTAWDGEQPADGEILNLFRLSNPLEIKDPGRMMCSLVLEKGASNMLRQLETRVGPGSGWASITCFIELFVPKHVI